MLCANTLTKQYDFDNAMKRQLIRLYDEQRSENYDCDNCKHLACTEVRAALFHSKCNPRQKSGFSKFGKVNQDKIDANEFCMKDMATARLMEKEKCAPKAERFVSYVFDKCKADFAPFVEGKKRKVKALNDIL